MSDCQRPDGSATARSGFFPSVAIAGLIGAIGAICAIRWFYRKDLDHALAAARRGAQMVDTASGPVEYAEAGAGIPLLSIHGAGGGFDQGIANAAAIVGEGFRVIAPSRFGYLRTPVPDDASPPAQADAHVALLAALKIPSAAVLGVSAGARSAVALAVRRPEIVNALVLVVPATYSPASPVAVDASDGSKLAFGFVSTGMDFAWWATEKVAPSMLVRFLGVAPELFAAAPRAERQRVIRLVADIQPLSLRLAGIKVDSAQDIQEPPLQDITAPTLIVSARDDLFNTAPAAEFAASEIPGARLILFDTGGHLLVGHLLEVRAAVRAFLTQAEPR
jgi:pimeloyl-ACP methyl ester carboxylesterase